MICHLKKLISRINLNRSKSGFTLVEVVVSIALLAIVLTVMADAFMTGLSFMGMARSKTQRSMNTAGGVAQATVSANKNANTYGPAVALTSQPDTAVNNDANFTINFTGTTVTVSGKYYTGTDGDVTYKSFVPSN